MIDTPQHHDTGYRLLFSYVELVRQLIEGFFPPELVELLDLDQLRNENASYITPAMKRKEEDVVWSVPLGNERLYLYILVEFQSSVDHSMPVRILQYVGALYDSLIKSERIDPSEGLPFVFPIVLYNGDYRWKVATNIHDMIHPVPTVLKPYQPNLSYFLIDEGSYSDESLAERQSAVSAVFSLENARTLEDAQQALRRMFTAIKGLPEKNRLDRALSHWVKRHLLKRMPNITIPETDYLLENVDMLATNIERWYEQAHSSGVTEGISQGISQGINQGIAQGKGQLLAYLLSKKFPNTSLDQYRGKIDNAAEEDVLRYSGRVLTANSIEEVFYGESDLS